MGSQKQAKLCVGFRSYLEARPGWETGRVVVDLTVPGNHLAVLKREATVVCYEVTFFARQERTLFLPSLLAAIGIEPSGPVMVEWLVHRSRECHDRNPKEDNFQ